MSAHRLPRWTPEELAILREQYPIDGMAVADRLPGRSCRSIYTQASKLGLRTTRVSAAPKAKLQGSDLDEAVRLREAEGWSFLRIGARFGLSEASACNAVTIALCTRLGFTPAERDETGRLTEQGLTRVRYALKKGLKGIDIQLCLGVSAGCVAEQRRRYNADLAARGKALLPPPGGGEAYSGVKLPRGKRVEVEALFLQGIGTTRVAQRTGVSKSSCARIRERLVRKLRRQGETLPGCDAQGIRRVYLDSAGHITAEQKQLLRAALLEGMPVRRAALRLAIGSSAAYQLRDELAAQLADQGKALARPVLPGKVAAGTFAEADWPPRGPRQICAFRQMLRAMPFQQAKDEWRRARMQERHRDQAEQRLREYTFEQQLARVAAGEIGLTNAFGRTHLEPRIGA